MGFLSKVKDFAINTAKIIAPLGETMGYAINMPTIKKDQCRPNQLSIASRT